MSSDYGSSKSFSSVSQPSNPSSGSPSSLPSSSLLSSSLLSSGVPSSSLPPSSLPSSSLLSSSLLSSSLLSSSLLSSSLLSSSLSSSSLSSSSRSSSSVSCASSCPSINDIATDDVVCPGDHYTKAYGFTPDVEGLMIQPVHWDIVSGQTGDSLSAPDSISGTLSWTVPSDAAPGQGYYFKMRCTDACGCVFYTDWWVNVGSSCSSSSSSSRSSSSSSSSCSGCGCSHAVYHWQFTVPPAGQWILDTPCPAGCTSSPPAFDGTSEGQQETMPCV